MDYLWSPWRMAYIEAAPKPAGCPLCLSEDRRTDAERLVVARATRAFVIMNLYPYNPGHLMIAPYQHTGSLNDLDAETLGEMMALSQHSLKVLERVMSPQGFNLGMNLGTVAGAGIADHLHLHIVPRWAADTNAMTVIGTTRVLPEALPSTYRKLVAAWDQP